jgi:hemin uptake protein HemP
LGITSRLKEAFERLLNTATPSTEIEENSLIAEEIPRQHSKDLFEGAKSKLP